jgi:hypothetical protein
MRQLLQEYGYSNYDVAYYMENHTEGRGGLYGSPQEFELLSSKDNNELLLEGVVNE